MAKGNDKVLNVMKQLGSLDKSNEEEELDFIRGTTSVDTLQGLKGKKMNISPNLLEAHPKNVFSMVHDNEYETLKAAISEFGITNPIVCYPEGDKYIILSGHRRTACAKELGLKSVPVNVIPKFKSELDTLTFLGIENMSSRVSSPIDIALFASEMMKQLDVEGYTGRKRDIIAERIPSIKGRMLQSYLKLLKLPTEFQEMIKNNYVNVKQGGLIVDMIEAGRDNEAITKYKDNAKNICAEDIDDNEKAKRIYELTTSLIKNRNTPGKDTKHEPRKQSVNSILKGTHKKIRKLAEERRISTVRESDKKEVLEEIENIRRLLRIIEEDLTEKAK